MIKISNQGFISELGQRTNNEDNCAFIKGATYVVCDGVGGAENGEIASEITVKCFMEAFKENPNADANQVLQTAEAKLSDYINEHPKSIGLGTTLTVSQVRDEGIYIAWCGDSRIYQFRNGEIIFQTTDHSWVNDALKSDIITPEEAVNHPKSNIITRAVQGSHKPTVTDTRLLTDIQKGDLFLHCSDGVLETWEDDDLKALFSSEDHPDKILEIIKRECIQHSRDNYTAIVYQIGEAVIEQKTVVPVTQTVVEAIPVNEKELISVNKQVPKSSSGKGNLLKLKIVGFPLIYILVAIVPLIIFLLLTNIKKDTPDKLAKPDLPAQENNQQPIQAAPAQISSDTIHTNDIPAKVESKSEIKKDGKNEQNKPTEQKSKNIK